METITKQLIGEKIDASLNVNSMVQQLAQKMNMSFNEFAGEMRKLGCSEPTAAKIWRGEYKSYINFNDHDISLSNLRKAAFVLKVGIGGLFPENCAEINKPENIIIANQNYMPMTPKEVDVE